MSPCRAWQGIQLILILKRQGSDSQIELHSNTLSAEKRPKEDISLGTHSFPNHQTGGWVLQIPIEPGPVPGQEDTTNTLRDRKVPLTVPMEPLTACGPPYSILVLLPWVHLPLVLPETIPSFPSFPTTQAEEFRAS